MATHDYVLANQSGSSFRTDLNNALAAIVSGNSSGTEPSTTYAYMIWNDSGNGLRKIRNSANNAWITLSTLTGGNVFDDDVTFTGASYNLVWDKSDSALEFADSAKAIFGAGSDLYINHNGTDSNIINGTGDLYIQNTGDDINIRANDDINLQVQNGESGINIIGDGSVELYYDNSKKFETLTDGVHITGTTYLDDSTRDDNKKSKFGAGDDLQIWHDGSHSYLQNTTGNFYIQPKSGENAVKIVPDGAVELYYDDTKKFETISEGARVQGNEGASAVLELWADQGDDNADKWRLVSDQSSNYFYLQNYAAGSFETSIRASGNGNVELYYDNVKKFETTTGGSKVTGNAIITGDIVLDSDSNKLKLGASEDLQIYHEGSNSYIENGIGHLIINSSATTNVDIMKAGHSEYIARFIPDGAVKLYYDNSVKILTADGGVDIGGWCRPTTDDYWDVGHPSYRWDDIRATNGSIVTSDKNEKNTIVDSDLGLSFVNKLKPVSYKFNGKTRTHYGLIAQDVETTLSDISKPTSGFAGFVKDDVPDELYVDEDSLPEGKKVGDLKRAAYTSYGLRYNEFISPLIKAVQELSAEVETLKTKVAALEG